MLDKIILQKCSGVFLSSDLQYGFKQKHSTNQCTFVVNEVIQYYMNNNTNVLVTLLDASKAFDRVEYIKLFKLLISKNICPVVARFLIVLYTNQTFRVRWCSHTTSLVNACNGVKQGGVMSPLLFTVYIDVLLMRLKQSSLGCYIGTTFCGAFGYADDVILLAPTANSLTRMLKVCCEYAAEYNVIFNPDKTKLIVRTHDHTCHLAPDITFMSRKIVIVPYEKHLGFPVGNITFSEIMTKCIIDFMTKVNMVKSHFKHLPPKVMYYLFKTYCMPLYGGPLWDYGSKQVERFYTAWRKAVRYILAIPYRTHGNLLHLLCDDIPVRDQLYKRFVRFFNSLTVSNNHVTRMCASLAINGSNSWVGNNVTVCAEYFSMSRYDLDVCKCDFSENLSDDVYVNVDVIKELMEMKFNNFYSCNNFLLNVEECDELINVLCTS